MSANVFLLEGLQKGGVGRIEQISRPVVTYENIGKLYCTSSYMRIRKLLPATLTPMSTPAIILSIAGYDPSSGAGITADIKTAAAHGCYAVTCATALTVQSTLGVRRVEAVRAETVSETLAELASDVEFGAVRIGMLGSGAVARAVAAFLEQRRPKNVVLDPVLRSSSGAELLDSAGVEVLKNRLLPVADVITPNVDEAAALTGLTIADLAGMRAAGGRLQEMGCRAVVVTGGHLREPVDLLCFGEMERQYPGERIETLSTHGTGCAFATALACRLALGSGLTEAVELAKRYVEESIAGAVGIGRGHGPINHFAGKLS
jgi:hydroxymethylpyrimidine/phosphomethylpyrimidine kinase